MLGSRTIPQLDICYRPNAALLVIRKLLASAIGFQAFAEVCRLSAFSTLTITAGILRFTLTGRLEPLSAPPTSTLRSALDLPVGCG